MTIIPQTRCRFGMPGYSHDDRDHASTLSRASRREPSRAQRRKRLTWSEAYRFINERLRRRALRGEETVRSTGTSSKTTRIQCNSRDGSTRNRRAPGASDAGRARLGREGSSGRHGRPVRAKDLAFLISISGAGVSAAETTISNSFEGCTSTIPCRLSGGRFTRGPASIDRWSAPARRGAAYAPPRETGDRSPSMAAWRDRRGAAP